MNGELYIKIAGFVKGILGIKDASLTRKKWAKRIGSLLYHKKYTASELVALMCSMGMKKGSLVCVHASMMQFYNYKGTAEELIDAMLEAIGPEGTLVMPAFPVDILGYDYKAPFEFDVDNDRTGAGYLAEVFRKMPGVVRSRNAKASLCAIGPLAHDLVNEHTEGSDCWDEKSPWYKMCEYGGLVFNLGMPRSYIGTFHHCVESRLKNEYPYYAQFFNQKGCYKWKCGEAEGAYENIDSNLVRKTRESKVTKYFTESEWGIKRISNLEVKVFYAKHALQTMLELGKKGICVYRIPSVKGYEF